MTNISFNPGDIIITSHAVTGEYGMHTIAGTNGGGNIAMMKDSPYWDRRYALEYNPGTTEEGYPYTHTLYQSDKWSKRNPKGSKAEPVNIINHFTKEEAAKRNIDRYYANLYKAHNLLADIRRATRHDKPVPPLNQWCNNPHTVASEQDVTDIIRCFQKESNEHVENYRKETGWAVDIINDHARQDEEQVNAYMGKVRASKVESGCEFIYLQDGITGIYDMGVTIGDILQITTRHGWQYFQVTGGNTKNATLKNLDTGDESTLAVVATHDDSNPSFCQPDCGLEFHYKTDLQLGWADGTVDTVAEYTILPSPDLELVEDYHALVTGQHNSLHSMRNMLGGYEQSLMRSSFTLANLCVETDRLLHEVGNIFRIQKLKEHTREHIKHEVNDYLEESKRNHAELWSYLQGIAEFNR